MTQTGALNLDAGMKRRKKRRGEEGEKRFAPSKPPSLPKQKERKKGGILITPFLPSICEREWRKG